MARAELYNHVPTDELKTVMICIREKYIELSEYLDLALPSCRSASLAQTHLEDSLMRAIQAVALQGKKLEKGE